MLRLSYTALSPFCRKVRMVMEHMGLDFEIFDSCDIRKYPAFNPRAELPILEDGETVVRNSSTILDYLHKRFPDASSLWPVSPHDYALAKEWELTADTMVDPIITNCAIFNFGELPKPPAQLQQAATNDLKDIYNRFSAALGDNEYLTGELSIADLALYPHFLAAQKIGLPISECHENIAKWLGRIMKSEIGQSDLKAVREWWRDLENQDVETDKINWGTYRLEWFLAHGFHDWFYNEIKRDAVLWSVGPKNNSTHSPHHPQRAA